MNRIRQQLQSNLERVREQIAEACTAAGRPPQSVRLLAITKYVDAQVASELVAAGCRELGESRPQELSSKAMALADPSIAWHLVGHLQRNKIKLVLPHASLIHSVDSWRLLQSIQTVAASLDIRSIVLLEVDISGDINKQGMTPDQVREVLLQSPALTHVNVMGLMGMAGLKAPLKTAQKQFASLRELRDRLQSEFPSLQLNQLSMGMSADFPQAISEGATIVRIGSLLFEGIDTPNDSIGRA